MTTLLYADDLVIFAESAAELQLALDAVALWGKQWRFPFGVCPEKSAPLCCPPRGAPVRYDHLPLTTTSSLHSAGPD